LNCADDQKEAWKKGFIGEWQLSGNATHKTVRYPYCSVGKFKVKGEGVTGVRIEFNGTVIIPFTETQQGVWEWLSIGEHLPLHALPFTHVDVVVIGSGPSTIEYHIKEASQDEYRRYHSSNDTVDWSYSKEQKAQFRIGCGGIGQYYC
jgi:hypothetical protein